jgi:hypothetical protein
MQFANESCSGGKLSKERLSILLCTNMDGSERKKVDVIGKSARPRCFSGKSKSLPVNYHSNSKAWMTSDLWRQIMTKLNKRMSKEERSILMFVDNCSSHPQSLRLSNIKFVYLPANTTSISQPLDGGVIKAFKGNYRRLMIKRLLAIINSGEKITSNSISLLDTVFMIQSAWNDVKQSTIQNCFRKCGFESNNLDVFSEDTEDYSEEVDEIDEIWERAQQLLGIDIEFNDFIEIDKNLIVNENLTEEVIIQEIIGKRSDNRLDQSIDLEEESDNEINELSEEESSPPSIMDAIKAISTLRQYFVNSNTTDDEVMNELNHIDKKIFEYNFKNVKQSKITDCFHL